MDAERRIPCFCRLSESFAIEIPPLRARQHAFRLGCRNPVASMSRGRTGLIKAIKEVQGRMRSSLSLLGLLPPPLPLLPVPAPLSPAHFAAQRPIFCLSPRYFER